MRSGKFSCSRMKNRISINGIIFGAKSYRRHANCIEQNEGLNLQIPAMPLDRNFRGLQAIGIKLWQISRDG